MLRGDPTADLALAPYDYLSIKEVSRWRGEESVTLRGEVVFPGTYPIRRGETLSSVLERAGGLTDLAFPEGSVFTRVELREREREQLERAGEPLERDLAALSVTDPDVGDHDHGRPVAARANCANTVPTGRWVIRLDDLVAGDEDADIVLKDGDSCIVPDVRQEVTVLGEVQYATSHVFERPRSRRLHRSQRRPGSGPTRSASTSSERTARSSPYRGGLVPAGRRPEIRPGDSIVVPLDVDQPLARWGAITQIIYNLALAAAAVASFDGDT